MSRPLHDLVSDAVCAALDVDRTAPVVPLLADAVLEVVRDWLLDECR